MTARLSTRSTYLGLGGLLAILAAIGLFVDFRWSLLLGGVIAVVLALLDVKVTSEREETTRSLLHTPPAAAIDPRLRVMPDAREPSEASR